MEVDTFQLPSRNRMTIIAAHKRYRESSITKITSRFLSQRSTFRLWTTWSILCKIQDRQSQHALTSQFSAAKASTCTVWTAQTILRPSTWKSWQTTTTEISQMAITIITTESRLSRQAVSSPQPHITRRSTSQHRIWSNRPVISWSWSRHPSLTLSRDQQKTWPHSTIIRILIVAIMLRRHFASHQNSAVRMTLATPKATMTTTSMSRETSSSLSVNRSAQKARRDHRQLWWRIQEQFCVAARTQPIMKTTQRHTNIRQNRRTWTIHRSPIASRLSQRKSFQRRSMIAPRKRQQLNVTRSRKLQQAEDSRDRHRRPILSTTTWTTIEMVMLSLSWKITIEDTHQDNLTTEKRNWERSFIYENIRIVILNGVLCKSVFTPRKVSIQNSHLTWIFIKEKKSNKMKKMFHITLTEDWSLLIFFQMITF